MVDQKMAGAVKLEGEELDQQTFFLGGGMH
jgi:hypothetical protein